MTSNFEFQIRAKTLVNHMKRAAFCTDIQGIIIEIDKDIMKTSAVGVTNDRVGIIRTRLEKPVEEPAVFGIPGIRKVIDKVKNFDPDDMLTVSIDNNNQMKILRPKPKKTYTVSTVEELKHIRSKCVYDIWVDPEKMEFCLQVEENPVQMAGKIEVILTLPNLSGIQKIFREKDVFTDEIELSLRADGTVEIMGREEDDFGSDMIEGEMTIYPEEDIIMGYSGLIEVIKSLNPKANITLYGGKGTMSLVITEERNTPEESYRSIYMIMTRTLRWS